MTPARFLDRLLGRTKPAPTPVPQRPRRPRAPIVRAAPWWLPFDDAHARGARWESPVNTPIAVLRQMANDDG